MTKTAILLSILIGLTSKSEARQFDLSEEEAANLRPAMGIQTVSENSEYSLYAFRDEGHFLISKTNFSSSMDAKAFCERQPGFKLTAGTLPGLLTFMGLPFVQLMDQAVVNAPVLGASGGRTGVVSWVYIDPATIEDLANSSSGEDRKVFDLVRSNDYILALLSGDGGSGSGIHSYLQVNQRLKALGLKPLLLPALCEDAKLGASFER